MRNYYVPGQWNALCDVCGFKFKSGMLKRRWDGLMVCQDDFETRHPQDLLRVPREDTSVPWARMEPTDSFITFYLVTEAGTVLVTEDGTPISYLA